MILNDFFLTELCNNILNQLFSYYSIQLNKVREELLPQEKLAEFKKEQLNIKTLIDDTSLFSDNEKLESTIRKYSPILSGIYESC